MDAIPLASERSATTASARAVTAAVAGLAAAWISSASLGLLALPLRGGLLAVALLVLLVTLGTGRRPVLWMLLLGSAGLTLLLAATTPVGGTFGVALVLAVWAGHASGGERCLALLTTQAITTLGLYRLAVLAIPTVGSLASIGSIQGGLDLWVPLVVLFIGWLRGTAPPHRVRAFGAVVALAAVQLGSRALLAATPWLLTGWPAPAAAPADPYIAAYQPPLWEPSQAVRAMLPWNLPLVAGVLDLLVLAFLLRGSVWRVPPATTTANRRERLGTLVAILAAMTLPWIVGFSPAGTGLSQRTILVYDPGHLDWKKPVHGLYGHASAGRYGMLPVLIESLDGQLVRSTELSTEELARADVLLLLEPEQPLSEEQLQRLWNYVGNGGSLLVVGGSPTAVNPLLKPTAMQVRTERARTPVAYWEHTLQIAPHPVTAGLEDRHNRFGLQQGHAIETAWPTRPLLVGRWGWRADAGADWQGEPVGDQVLVAEQPVGRGTVLVLGDSFGLTNEGLPAAFVFVGRLFSYLASPAGSPQTDWRQALGIVTALLLLLLVWRGREATRLALVAGILGISWVAVQTASKEAPALLPDGRQSPMPVAYLDASHVEAFSAEPWGFDGVAGLLLTLMRNGYLPLLAPDLAPARLERASLVISIAPARAFSAAERQAIRHFVDRGGHWLSMAGGPDSGPSAALLADWGFCIPPMPLPTGSDAETTPAERRLTTPYLRAAETGSHDCFVWFDAAWPIECDALDVEVLCHDFDERPILAVQPVGRGCVAVVGDTGFAMNKNLEYAGGQSFGGGYENAHFWRWFLGLLRGESSWIPPAPPGQEPQP